jgi:transcription elongation factor Elf1
MKPWERHLLERLVCPRCGAKNTPEAIIIQMDRAGNARCTHCGKEDAVKAFLPPSEEPPLSKP